MASIRDHLPRFIHQTGSTAQHKHDLICDQIFAGSPTDNQHIIYALNLINELDVNPDNKKRYEQTLLTYVSTGGDRAAARAELDSFTYVQAVAAASRALKHLWRMDRTLLDLLRPTIKTIAAQTNYRALFNKKCKRKCKSLPSKPSKTIHSLFTKIIPAHAPNKNC
jgi:hypothetical protein